MAAKRQKSVSVIEKRSTEDRTAIVTLKSVQFLEWVMDESEDIALSKEGLKIRRKIESKVKYPGKNTLNRRREEAREYDEDRYTLPPRLIDRPNIQLKDLQRILLEIAQSRYKDRVSIHKNCDVKSVNMNTNFVQTSNGHFVSKHLVIAEGARRDTVKMLGIDITEKDSYKCPTAFAIMMEAENGRVPRLYNAEGHHNSTNPEKPRDAVRQWTLRQLMKYGDPKKFLALLKKNGWHLDRLPVMQFSTEKAGNKIWVTGERPPTIDTDQKLEKWVQLILKELEITKTLTVKKRQQKATENPKSSKRRQRKNKLNSQLFVMKDSHITDRLLSRKWADGKLHIIGDAHQPGSFYLGHGIDQALSHATTMFEYIDSENNDDVRLEPDPNIQATLALRGLIDINQID